MSILKRIRRYFMSSIKRARVDGVQLGKNVSIMGGCNFGSEPYLVTLEDEVRVSFGVTFVTHDGGTWAFRDLDGYKDIIKFGKIRVGYRSFIGCNTTIMPGVTIGKRCVIGAGSVVTRDVPDGTVVVGVPAKAIMTTEEYAQKCKAAMKPVDWNAYHKDKKAYLQEWL